MSGRRDRLSLMEGGGAVDSHGLSAVAFAVLEIAGVVVAGHVPFATTYLDGVSTMLTVEKERAYAMTS